MKLVHMARGRLDVRIGGVERRGKNEGLEWGRVKEEDGERMGTGMRAERRWSARIGGRRSQGATEQRQEQRSGRSER